MCPQLESWMSKPTIFGWNTEHMLLGNAYQQLLFIGLSRSHGVCSAKAHVLLNGEKVFTDAEWSVLFAEQKIIPAVQHGESFCCLKPVAPGDTFVWAGFWQHDLIIMLNPCSSCLYTNSLAIQMSTLFVILKSGWYQSESFFFWLAFSKDNLREFSTEAAASAAQCIWLSFNHLAILGLKMWLFLGLESCDMTVGGDNAFFLMHAHCRIGFMFYICLLPRQLLLREKWNQTRGVFVICNSSISLKGTGLCASSGNQ